MTFLKVMLPAINVRFAPGQHRVDQARQLVRGGADRGDSAHPRGQAHAECARADKAVHLSAEMLVKEADDDIVGFARFGECWIEMEGMAHTFPNMQIRFDVQPHELRMSG